MSAKKVMDWAETLLCNARPMGHCSQQEWNEIIERWMDAKHSASDELLEARALLDEAFGYISNPPMLDAIGEFLSREQSENPEP